MSNNEDLSFLNLPKFKSFKVASGRTYVQLDDKGNSIAVSFSSWKDAKTSEFVTGVIVRPVLKMLNTNAEECKEAVESGGTVDPQNKVIRKQKTLHPTHWGFASPKDVLTVLEDRDFFPRLVAKIKDAYEIELDVASFKQFIMVSDMAFNNAVTKDFREVIDVVL